MELKTFSQISHLNFFIILIQSTNFWGWFVVLYVDQNSLSDSDFKWKLIEMPHSYTNYKLVASVNNQRFSFKYWIDFCGRRILASTCVLLIFNFSFLPSCLHNWVHLIYHYINKNERLACVNKILLTAGSTTFLFNSAAVCIIW